MNSEERKSIEHFKSLNKLALSTNLDLKYTQSEIDNSNTLIELINKDEKIIKKLKQDNLMLLAREDINSYKNFQNNYISVQTIKDTMTELEEKIKYENNEKVIIRLHKQIRILEQLINRGDK